MKLGIGSGDSQRVPVLTSSPLAVCLHQLVHQSRVLEALLLRLSDDRRVPPLIHPKQIQIQHHRCFSRANTREARFVPQQPACDRRTAPARWPALPNQINLKKIKKINGNHTQPHRSPLPSMTELNNLQLWNSSLGLGFWPLPFLVFDFGKSLKPSYPVFFICKIYDDNFRKFPYV